MYPNNKNRFWKLGIAGALLLLAAINTFALAQGETLTVGWTKFELDSAQLGATSVSLADIGAVAPNDIWVVGSYIMASSNISGTSAPQVTAPSSVDAEYVLLEHWDGTVWSIDPASGDYEGKLAALAWVGTKDIWAVGSYWEQTTPGQTRSLVLHWNGTGWQKIEAPGEGFKAVSATGPRDVWIVTVNADVMHWNGSEWRQLPEPSERQTAFDSLVAVADNSVWAAGSISTGSSSGEGFVGYWDGTSWASFPRPNDLPISFLTAIDAVSPRDVWAVGNSWSVNTPGRSESTTIEHWDGTGWQQWSVNPINVPADQNGSRHNLVDVQAMSANDVWAVGNFYNIYNADLYQMLLLHWDGTSWSSVPDPLRREGIAPAAVAVVSDGADQNIWIAGSNSILRYTATRPAQPGITPTATVGDPSSLPGSNSRTFPATGKTVSGIFLDYWEQHGGLAQQGYPISNPIIEVSELNGRSYTVQYFERAVFEYHPENASTPYEVLLSQLGTFRYRQNYQHGRSDQKPNNDRGSIFIPQTGKRIGGSFLEYWSANGGVQQQGYPISDEFVELNDLDGKLYTVQYFERAVFEYHSGNTKPYDVLLSQLGTFRYREKYPSSSLHNIMALPGAGLRLGR